MSGHIYCMLWLDTTIHWQLNSAKHKPVKDTILYKTPAPKCKLYHKTLGTKHKLGRLWSAHALYYKTVVTQTFNLYLICKHDTLRLHPRALCLQMRYKPHGCVIRNYYLAIYCSDCSMKTILLSSVNIKWLAMIRKIRIYYNVHI